MVPTEGPGSIRPVFTAEEAAGFAFPPRAGGYRRDEVEALRSRVVSALAESSRGLVEGLAVGADELLGASFSTSIRGYEPAVVDDFLRGAADVLAERGVTSGRRRVTAAELELVRFRWQVDGYRAKAVRRLLERVAEALEAHHVGSEPGVTRGEIDRLDLPLRLLGYSCDEVETVLGRVSVTLSFYESRGPITPQSEGGGGPSGQR